jgi:hypothetical protein
MSVEIRAALSGDAPTISALNADVQQMHADAYPWRFKSPGAHTFTEKDADDRSAAGRPHQTRFLDEPCRRGDKTTSRRARSDSPRSIFRLPSGRAERSETATAMSPSDRNKRKFNVKERTHFRAVLVRQSFRLEVRTPRGADK